MTPILDIPQGMIRLDSGEFAEQIGFISDYFKADSYLWGNGNTIIISCIESRTSGKGYLRALFKACWYLGFDIVVPTPLHRMKRILRHYGFTMEIIDDPVFDRVEVWTKKATTWG